MLIARKDKGKGTAARGAKQCAQKGGMLSGEGVTENERAR